MNILAQTRETIAEHFARFMCTLATSEDPKLFFAARAAAEAVEQSHVCVDLTMVKNFERISGDAADMVPVDPAALIENLKKSEVVGAPGDYRPLILDKTKLYLYAYWKHEQTVADFLMRRAAQCNIPDDPGRFAALIERYFPVPDEHCRACCIAGLKPLLVLSGGPGTGKTTTVAKIAAFLVEYLGAKQCRIALTAPTGKAAARLMQSISSACAAGNFPDEIQHELPRQAATIHRLLGGAPDSPLFKYNAENPLPYDLVVVDEVSMVDVTLLSHLLSAIRENAKVILIGDMNQLASVEAGAILSDICDSGKKHGITPGLANIVLPLLPKLTLSSGPLEPPMADAIVELTKSYRFMEHSGIASVSSALKEGDGAAAWNTMENAGHNDISRRAVPSPGLIHDELREGIIDHYGAACSQSDPLKALKLFNGFRVLCALNNGPYGVIGLNATIERILAEERIIRPNSRWYPGRPVMIKANDYRLGLFNGDCGIAMIDPSDGQLKVFFSADSDGALRTFAPSRLPQLETVFAMTIHKAQGSEFDSVLIVLPPEFSPVLSRELLYTAITRARTHCTLWCSKEIFLSTAQNKTMRMSGLRDALWESKGLA